MSAPFSRLVSGAMERRGLGLRELCRLAKIDPSFLSKVLAGKRNPPSEDEVLHRLAVALEMDPVELSVSAGRLPSEWKVLQSNPAVLARISSLLNSVLPARPAAASEFRSVRSSSPSKPPLPLVRKPFNEELL